MGRVCRVFLTASLVLLAGTTLAGCLEDIMVDPLCLPTAVAASWDQPGAFDALGDEAQRGMYNVSLREPAGFPFEDDSYGALALGAVEWDPGWMGNESLGVFRLDHTDRLRVVVPEGFDEERLNEGFMEFITSVTTADHDEAENLLQRFVENRHVLGASVMARSFDGDGESSEELMEYNITVAGPYRFEALYGDLLGDDDRPDPWEDGEVTLGEWTFMFPVPAMVAGHTTEAGRQLEVDARDRVSFQWDPPKGAGSEAIAAGIARTMSDLALPPPPPIAQVDVVIVRC